MTFTPGVPVSAAQLKKATITQTTDITAEAKVPGQVFYNMANNGAFKKDDIVGWNADGDGYVYLTQGKHYHDEDTNAAGGSLTDMFARNMSKFLYWAKLIGISVNDFMSMGTGGSTVLDHPTGAIKMDTSTTADNYRNLHLMGVPITFAKYSKAQSLMQFTGNTTNLFARWGIGMESLNLTNDSDPKYGIESCSATNGNWFITSADGASRTQQDSLKPLLGGGSDKSYIIENLAGTSINFQYATDAVVSKSSNLPTTGAVAKNNIVNYGVKTTDTNAKQLYIWGLAVVGTKDAASTWV